MAELDFNPDFSEEEEELPSTGLIRSEPEVKQVTVVNNTDNSVTLGKLVDMTKQHIQDDSRVRDEIDELTGILDGSMHQMSIKELLEYLKIKLKEREFHVKCIFDAYNFVQRSELAREMLVGGDRKERVNQSVNSTRLTKLIGYFNMNNKVKLD